jgi:DNA-binding MarR family transcriptional regulator
LAALNEVSGTPINPIADRRDIERTAMGKMVGFLEPAGLVGIHPSPTDGRGCVIELTETGRRLHNEAAPLGNQAQRQFAQLNGADNVAALRAALSSMAVGATRASSSD